jgi:hypothetical protein
MILVKIFIAIAIIGAICGTLKFFWEMIKRSKFAQHPSFDELRKKD